MPPPQSKRKQTNHLTTYPFWCRQLCGHLGVRPRHDPCVGHAPLPPDIQKKEEKQRDPTSTATARRAKKSGPWKDPPIKDRWAAGGYRVLRGDAYGSAAAHPKGCVVGAACAPAPRTSAARQSNASAPAGAINALLRARIYHFLVGDSDAHWRCHIPDVVRRALGHLSVVRRGVHSCLPVARCGPGHDDRGVQEGVRHCRRAFQMPSTKKCIEPHGPRTQVMVALSRTRRGGSA
jgi:hypothetical protein